jgi:hypothetical protein
MTFIEFGEGPLLFQHDNAPVHKARSIHKWFAEIGVEKLDWPWPQLNPTPLGWIGTLTSSQAKSPNISADLTNARDWMEASPRRNVLPSSGKPSQKIGCCCKQQRGDQPHITAHDFGMRCSTSVHILLTMLCTVYRQVCAFPNHVQPIEFNK